MTAKGGARVVLVVEDDESMREAIETLLSLSGFSTVLYESAEALLAEEHGERSSVCHQRSDPAGHVRPRSADRIASPGLAAPVIIITAFDSASTRQAASGLAPLPIWPNRSQALRC